MVINNKNHGFITTVVLLFMAGTVLIGANKVKNINQERHNFYRQNISSNREKELLKKDVFYFNFNSYVIKETDLLPLSAHARKLLMQPKLTVLIGGHTDSRGPIGYNFKLGLLRAKAIADVLNSKGIPFNRMTIISYSDQAPTIVAIPKGDITKLDRRAEIIYQYKERESDM